MKHFDLEHGTLLTKIPRVLALEQYEYDMIDYILLLLI